MALVPRAWQTMTRRWVRNWQPDASPRVIPTWRPAPTRGQLRRLGLRPSQRPGWFRQWAQRRAGRNGERGTPEQAPQVSGLALERLRTADRNRRRKVEGVPTGDANSSARAFAPRISAPLPNQTLRFKGFIERQGAELHPEQGKWFKRPAG
jgi:hypothetical protein